MSDVKAQRRHVVAACYMGWTLDAFDYFIMAFTLDAVAKEFNTDRSVAAVAFTATLAMRPIGALLFGYLADRFGRKPVLMASVLLYSIFEFASGLAPNLTSFLVLRGLFGIAMGGEWGVGASMTMETIPSRWRGVVSGLLQAGYPSGFLLATLVNWIAIDAVGWRGLFFIGALPALLVLYIRARVQESPDWRARAEIRTSSSRGNRFGVAELVVALRQHIGMLGYAVIMMAAFNFFSHGTQDLYKSFLMKERGLPLSTATSILVSMNIAAIFGGIFFAALSQRMGRRAAIATAALLSVPVIPLWAFSHHALMIGVGAFLMQFFVQGAWGVVPAHLNELSPPAIRGTFPGVTYTLGNLLASVNGPLQAGLADRYFGGNLSWPLALVVGAVAVLIAVLVCFGREARDLRMGGAVAGRTD